MNVSPEVIYIIRHAEKPLKPPLTGVDFAGGQNEHSLLPRGWQRSGALATLFQPEFGPVRAGLPVVAGTAIPRKWPGDRYDVIWSFTLKPEPGPVRYGFGQIPQRLLAGDAGTVIPVGIDGPTRRELPAPARVTIVGTPENRTRRRLS